MKDFFVSYSQADREWAEWIAWHLEGAGFEVVIQAWDFPAGGNFMQQMREAAAECARTMAVLSTDYLDSLYGQQEWNAALVADPTGTKGGLIPVRVKECELEGLDRPVVYIDLVGLEGDEERALEVLLQGVRRERAKPSKPPRMPEARQKQAATEPRYPGALPPVWNVPFRRNPNFSGREQELDRLRAAFASGEVVAPCQAITGMGGVGKTQLAVEYAYRYLGDYERVWWLRCGEAATLKSDYAALGRALGLKEQPELDKEVAQVKQWLDRHPGWLLIFDNARESDDLWSYLPRSGSGRVLITSRNRAWGAVATSFGVDLWPIEESVAFLEKRTGKSDFEAAATLAEELGRLPLALEQAAAYIVEKGRGLAGYLELYRRHHLEVLERDIPRSCGSADVSRAAYPSS